MIPVPRREQIIVKSEKFRWSECYGRNKRWTYNTGAREQHLETEWSGWVFLMRLQAEAQSMRRRQP